VQFCKKSGLQNARFHLEYSQSSNPFEKIRSLTQISLLTQSSRPLFLLISNQPSNIENFGTGLALVIKQPDRKAFCYQ